MSQEVFNAIQERWGPFDIDLFASRLNFKVPQYVSWRPDPGAHFINAFFMDWKPHYFYAFPPFSVIANCLQKIQKDQSTELLIAPLWTTQPWFTPLLNHLTDHPLVLPQSDTLLVQPHSNAIHPLSKRLQLKACKGILPPARYFKQSYQHHLAVLVSWYPKTICPLYQEVA